MSLSKVAGRATNGRRLFMALAPIACGNKWADSPHMIAEGELFTRRMQPGGGKARTYPMCRDCFAFEERPSEGGDDG
jgi:hypothetical protein